MNIINGLASGCCGSPYRNNPYYGPGYNCPIGRNPINAPYYPGYDCGYGCGCAPNLAGRNVRGCNKHRHGCGCREEFFPAYYGDYGYNRRRDNFADIQIICVDKDCNPIYDCVYQLSESNGCCKTIDLHNCNRSGHIHLPGGCSVLENISTPDGVCRLDGKIYCDVSCDSCGHEICTVSADKSLDDNLSIRREFGTTIITCQYDRELNSGCNSGCACSNL